MGRGLSIFLIVVGFLALIALAFVPRSVSVIVDINVADSSPDSNAGEPAVGGEAPRPGDE